MTTAEAIYELVKKLPDEQMNLVMGFIQFLLKGEWTVPVPSTSAEVSQSSVQLSWPEFVQSLSGSWSDFPDSDFPDIDEIRGDQGQDCQREIL
ncbi:hypothetical protein Lepto7375DRAFT_7323 [Leptolyngbya sp. PCC 7375]|nr:hypothetical protein Lepto7375DRAFT_7323 [Leptolyngbya sp. PCC 7375]